MNNDPFGRSPVGWLINPLKRHFIISAIALIAIGVCWPCMAGFEGKQSDQEATSLLTNGTWKFSNTLRRFHPDGTFDSNNRRGYGTWKIGYGELDIAFADNTRHRFYLPIDPAGTRGDDFNGKPELLVRVNPAPPPPKVQTDKEVIFLLTTGTWKFSKTLRVFNPDGTFTSNNLRGTGTWRINNGEVDITFADNTWHRFYLPIDPAGTRGDDFNGKPEILERVSPLPR